MVVNCNESPDCGFKREIDLQVAFFEHCCRVQGALASDLASHRKIVETGHACIASKEQPMLPSAIQSKSQTKEKMMKISWF